MKTEDGGWTDQAISKALDISISTIERVRRRLVEQGIEAALWRQTLKNTKSHKLDGEQEAHLLAIACSQAPVGFARWTLRLLAKRMVEVTDRRTKQDYAQQMKYLVDILYPDAEVITEQRNRESLKIDWQFTTADEERQAQASLPINSILTAY